MKLYYTEASPPCRTIVLMANLLNVKLEMITTSPKNGETNTSSFLQMNPQHVVPTLVDDDGYVIWESRAIAKYLTEKYGKCTHLYPLDFKTRIEIDKILDFDLGTVFRRSTDYFVTILLTGKFDPSKKPRVDDAMKVLNEILKRNETNFVVGNHLTIADISLLTIVTGYNLNSYENVQSWISNVKKNIPDYDTIGVKGESAFQQMFKAYEK